jgi:hypothetical protein
MTLYLNSRLVQGPNLALVEMKLNYSVPALHDVTVQWFPGDRQWQGGSTYSLNIQYGKFVHTILPFVRIVCKIVDAICAVCTNRM